MIDDARRDLLKLAAIGTGATLAGGTAFAATAEAVPLPLAAATLARVFANPPAEARPAIYWYWMAGNVTREGITADLEAMQAVGITTVLLFSIGGAGPDTLIDPPAQSLTPHWWDLIRFAVTEADRLKLEIVMNACDGWATASGPWITPELSMQRLTWAEQQVDGGRRYRGTLPQPPRLRDYYRDLRIVAYRHPPEWEDTSATRTPRLSGTLPIADTAKLVDPDNRERMIDTEAAGDVVFAFERPFVLRSVTVNSPPGPNPAFGNVQLAANSLTIEASDDGLSWRTVTRLETPRHGWQTNLTTLTHAVPETCARIFRLVHAPVDPGPFREDMQLARSSRLVLASIVLSSRPAIHALPIKNADQWGQAHSTPADTACIPASGIIDLTDRIGADGTLDWMPPGGRWTLLRIGYTTNGKANSIAGNGQGLECDKLDRDAARVQFDGWYGQALKQVGPALAGRVLHVLHVDSWEAHSQNWTHDFPAEFTKRRGYDLMPLLAIATGVPVDSADFSERVLFDLRRTIADLASDNFYGEMARLAHDHGCLFSGEVANPIFPVDGLDYGAHVDIPMGEFWLRTPQNRKPSDIAEAASAAHVYGRRIAGAEAFTEFDLRFDETPRMMKPLGDHHFAQGINRFYLHVYAMQPWRDRSPGMTLSGIGSFFGRTQTWWRPGKAWIDYLSRSQALLQQGTLVAPIAMFIGEDIPARAILPGDLPVPLPEGYAYTSINRDALMRLARVEHGVLTLPGGARYHMLVLPDRSRMTPELAERLAGFAEAGLAIVGPAPTAGPGATNIAVSDARVRSAAARMRLRPYAESLSAILAMRGAPPNVLLSATGIEWLHRRGAGWDLFYLTNQRGHATRFTADVAAAGQAYRWDPERGTHATIADALVGNGRTTVAIDLPEGGAIFVLVTGPVSATAPARPLSRAETASDIIPLDGPWTLIVPGQPLQTHAALASWTDDPSEAIRFFSGTAYYRTSVRLPGLRGACWTLELGDVRELAAVRINGHDLGVLWTPPFALDVSEAVHVGTNMLEIAVTNTWRNRLIGDAAKPVAARKTFVTPKLKFGAEWMPKPDDALLPAGLLGPVRLVVRPND